MVKSKNRLESSRSSSHFSIASKTIARLTQSLADQIYVWNQRGTRGETSQTGESVASFTDLRKIKRKLQMRKRQVGWTEGWLTVDWRSEKKTVWYSAGSLPLSLSSSGHSRWRADSTFLGFGSQLTRKEGRQEGARNGRGVCLWFGSVLFNHISFELLLPRKGGCFFRLPWQHFLRQTAVRIELKDAEDRDSWGSNHLPFRLWGSRKIIKMSSSTGLASVNGNLVTVYLSICFTYQISTYFWTELRTPQLKSQSDNGTVLDLGIATCCLVIFSLFNT